VRGAAGNGGPYRDHQLAADLEIRFGLPHLGRFPASMHTSPKMVREFEETAAKRSAEVASADAA